MDHFNEIYRLQAVGAILSAMGLAEEALGDIDRLNMGLRADRASHTLPKRRMAS